jgi:hypothetical protein
VQKIQEDSVPKIGASHGGRKENRYRRLKREDIPHAKLFDFSAQLTTSEFYSVPRLLTHCSWKTLPLTVCQYASVYGNVTPTAAIDYRCDDDKKKIPEVGRHLGIIAQLKTPGFQKCRSLTLSKHLIVRKLKKTILHELSIPNLNFSEFAFFGK